MKLLLKTATSDFRGTQLLVVIDLTPKFLTFLANTEPIIKSTHESLKNSNIEMDYVSIKLQESSPFYFEVISIEQFENNKQVEDFIADASQGKLLINDFDTNIYPTFYDVAPKYFIANEGGFRAKIKIEYDDIQDINSAYVLYDELKKTGVI